MKKNKVKTNLLTQSKQEEINQENFLKEEQQITQNTSADIEQEKQQASNDTVSNTETEVSKQKNLNFEKEKTEQPEEKRNYFLRFMLVFFTISLIVLAVYLPLKLSGSLDKISSIENLKEIILESGVWGYLFFFAIQFIQVTFIPIPAFVTSIAGTLVFGPWTTLWISLVAVILASMLSFWLGRKFGKKLVYWIVGKNETEKYNQKLKKGEYVFFLMMLFPGFPDDILCMIAGMTDMSFKFFLTTNLITRPIVLSVIIFFGSGIIIPFSGWGIYVWIVLLILMALAFYISIKKQKQIETFLLKISNKLSKRKNKKQENIIQDNNTQNDNTAEE